MSYLSPIQGQVLAVRGAETPSRPGVAYTCATTPSVSSAPSANQVARPAACRLPPVEPVPQQEEEPGQREGHPDDAPQQPVRPLDEKDGLETRKIEVRVDEPKFSRPARPW